MLEIVLLTELSLLLADEPTRLFILELSLPLLSLPHLSSLGVELGQLSLTLGLTT